jgi:fatty-acyl-CoA synthase
MQWSHEPLTPIAFLERSAVVHGDRTAVVHEGATTTYADLGDRARRLAGALAAAGVEPGDRVAVLAPNVPVALEAHFGVPMAGAVLVALNTRLSAGELRGIVEHAGATLLIADDDLLPVAREVAGGVRGLRVVDDAERENLMAAAPPLVHRPRDERSLLAVNYTSGTTGSPKGVMYNHRGAYLQSLAMALHAGLESRSAFLWTLPMFHCNGWCFPWAVTAVGATHVCLRKVEPAAVWRAIHHQGITHLNAAPTVLVDLAHHPDAAGGAPRRVRVATGGAPPAPALLQRLAALNVEVTHLYGLTETYGPSVVCDWHPEWDALPPDDRARRKARQGVGNVVSEQLRVIGDDGLDVPADGVALGEIALRGNNVMAGYYLDPEATARACPDGWFRTGDLGVLHPNGYVEVRDRAKDVIISGGENISSVEVEQALVSHPEVLEAAVVAAPDARWGEVPVAYVTLVVGATTDEHALLAHVQSRLARFKAPKRVVVGPLPKTATGKIQKFALRELEWRGHDRRISG